MDAPKPKKEMLIKLIGERIYRIFPASSDAALWLESAAPLYGSLYKETEKRDQSTRVHVFRL